MFHSIVFILNYLTRLFNLLLSINNLVILHPPFLFPPKEKKILVRIELFSCDVLVEKAVHNEIMNFPCVT